MIAFLFAAVLVGQSAATGSASPSGVVSEIRIQGNAVTPDEDVIRFAGLRVGAPFDAATIQRAQASLEKSGRFEHVEVLQRFASLSDPSKVLIVIIVDEGPLTIEGKGAAQRIVRSRGPHLLFMPVLGYEEGYGVTYGAQFAKANPAGPRSRLSFPLTWGGDKRAGVNFEKELSRGPLTRVVTSFSVSRRTNPFFGEDDSRAHVSVRAERQLFGNLNLGATWTAEHVSFADAGDRVITAGLDATIDTRLDPMLARNAVYGHVGWDHVSVRDGVTAKRTSLEGRVYVGLIGQSVLELRARRDSSDQPLPAYLQPLLGGMETLRGFRAGYAAGDTRVAGSAELRVPLTSPLHVVKFGVSAFTDAGTVYASSARLKDQSLDRGVGGGVWFAATVLRVSLDVAHGVGASTRVHVAATMSFRNRH